MTQIRVQDTVYEVHTTANGREKHSHIVMVGRRDRDSKIIGVVSRLVTWEAVLQTPEGLKVIAEFQYRQQAIAALVRAWHAQVWEQARKRIKVVSG